MNPTREPTPPIPSPLGMAVTAVVLVVPVPAFHTTPAPVAATPPAPVSDVPVPSSGPMSSESGMSAAWQFCSCTTTE